MLFVDGKSGCPVRARGYARSRSVPFSSAESYPKSKPERVETGLIKTENQHKFRRFVFEDCEKSQRLKL